MSSGSDVHAAKKSWVSSPGGIAGISLASIAFVVAIAFCYFYKLSSGTKSLASYLNARERLVAETRFEGNITTIPSGVQPGTAI